MQELDAIIEKQKAKQVYLLRHLPPEQISYDTGLELSYIQKMLNQTSCEPLTAKERVMFDNHSYFEEYKKSIKKRRKLVEDIIKFKKGNQTDADAFCDKKAISIRDFKEISHIITTLNLDQPPKMGRPKIEKPKEIKPRVIIKEKPKKIEKPKIEKPRAEKPVIIKMKPKRFRVNPDRSRLLEDEFDMLMATLNHYSVTLVRVHSTNEKNIEMTKDKPTMEFSNFFYGVLQRNYDYIGKVSKKLLFEDGDKTNILSVEVILFNEEQPRFYDELGRLFNKWKELGGTNLFFLTEDLPKFYQCLTVSSDMFDGLGKAIIKKGNVGALYSSVKLDVSFHKAVDLTEKFFIPLHSDLQIASTDIRERASQYEKDQVNAYLNEKYPNQSLNYEIVQDVAKHFNIKTQKRLYKILGLPSVDNEELYCIRRKFYHFKMKELGLENKSLNEIGYALNLTSNTIRKMKIFEPAEPFTERELITLKTHSFLKDLDHQGKNEQLNQIDELLEPYLHNEIDPSVLKGISEKHNIPLYSLKSRATMLRAVKGIHCQKQRSSRKVKKVEKPKPIKVVLSKDDTIQFHIGEIKRWKRDAQKLNQLGIVELCENMLNLITLLKTDSERLNKLELANLIKTNDLRYFIDNNIVSEDDKK